MLECANITSETDSLLGRFLAEDIEVQELCEEAWNIRLIASNRLRPSFRLVDPLLSAQSHE